LRSVSPFFAPYEFAIVKTFFGKDAKDMENGRIAFKQSRSDAAGVFVY